MILVSWVYDFMYLFLFTSAEGEDEEDGGMEYNVRRFSRLFAYISFFFRIVVFAVFWKDSVDFNRIIRNKNPLQAEGGDGVDEGELNNILAEYEADNQLDIWNHSPTPFYAILNDRIIFWKQFSLVKLISQKNILLFIQ